MSNTDHEEPLNILNRKRYPGEWYAYAIKEPELNRKCLDQQADIALAHDEYVGAILHPEEYYVNFPLDSQSGTHMGVEFFPCEFAIIDGARVEIEPEFPRFVDRKNMDAQTVRISMNKIVVSPLSLLVRIRMVLATENLPDKVCLDALIIAHDQGFSVKAVFEGLKTVRVRGISLRLEPEGVCLFEMGAAGIKSIKRVIELLFPEVLDEEFHPLRIYIRHHRNQKSGGA